uniref:DRBM domain-containing protein n=1 Tax=Anopheles minimus TaxID=112268 RepID=A0A182WCH0_9DIPT
MDFSPVPAITPMENDQLADCLSETTGPEAYFDYPQYVHRLFNEYEWRTQQTSDACSDSEYAETVIESVYQSCGEVENPRIQTEHSLSAIHCKAIQKRRKEAKLRQLRKMLLPKNSISVLHEILGPKNTEFFIYQYGSDIKAKVTVNNVSYEAIDRSKNLAKKNVSEQVLRDLVVTQMANVGTDAKSQNDATKNLPVEHLASFALHKLFTEWNVNGFNGNGKEAPTMHPPVKQQQTGVSYLPKVTKTVADLPPDASLFHPGVLFAYMRPQVAYDDHGLVNNRFYHGFVASLRTDGCCYYGIGQSKKQARKAAAVEACKHLFGVVFDESVVNG